MLNNYQIHPEYGVLTQIQRQPFVYDEDYVSAYDKLQCQRMSKLRFDNIVNAMGCKPASVLDVGYGNGSFLEYCVSKDIPFCYGYDITNKDVPAGAFRVTDMHHVKFVHVITFFDAIEHTEDIKETIISLPAHRFVVITVPACKEYLGNIVQFDEDWFDGWKHKKDNEHLWHFSPASLILFMTMNGYSLVSLNHCEDEIRKSDTDSPNIITGIFKKN